MGVEREGLRCDPSGWLSQKAHPVGLGSKLSDPQITTDFGEAQVELVTGPHATPSAVVEELAAIHCRLHRHLEDELLWPYSTPCLLPEEEDIQIAEFGSSPAAHLKELYRRGLSLRYGRKVMTLSGIHYNQSFSNDLWESLPSFPARGSMESAAYLHSLREFTRLSWLTALLFGASPAAPVSYCVKEQGLEALGEGSVYAPRGTSLRLGGSGYYGHIQELSFSYDTLEEYLAGMRQALSQEHPVFSGVDEGVEQVNGCLLQMEAEHYAVARPKPLAQDLRPVDALARDGVGYLEIRCLDLNPSSPLGISLSDLHFLWLLLLYCLFQAPRSLPAAEQKEAEANLYAVAKRGMDPSLILTEQGVQCRLHRRAQQILDEMDPLAALLDHGLHERPYSQSLIAQKSTLTRLMQGGQHPLIEALEGRDWIDLGIQRAQEQQRALQDPLLFQVG
jgi:glutamate--cysteine ligase